MTKTGVGGKVDAGDGAGVAADVEESAVGCDDDASRCEDAGYDFLDAGGECDSLDMAGGELADVGEAVGLIERDLIDAVEARGDDRGGGSVEVGEAETQGSAGVLCHVGVDAVC